MSGKLSDAVLDEKIENLRNCLQRIQSKVPFDEQTLRRDFDLQDIISINLERAVQTSVDIGSHILSIKGMKPPDTMADIFLKLFDSGLIDEPTKEALVKSIGMRNMMVHEYAKINWTTVHHVCHHDLHVYPDYVRQILAVG